MSTFNRMFGAAKEDSVSSNPPAPKRAHARIALFSVLSLGLTAIPLALGVPAQAAYDYACTVTPQTPAYSHDASNGVKVIDYKIKVHCKKGRYLNIEQKREEDDYTYAPPWDANDYLGTTKWTNVYVSAGESRTLHNYRTLVDTEVGKEEVFQRARFQEGLDGLWSPWSSWKSTYNLSISN
jgi:hypothetical protein